MIPVGALCSVHPGGRGGSPGGGFGGRRAGPNMLESKII